LKSNSITFLSEIIINLENEINENLNNKIKYRSLFIIYSILNKKIVKDMNPEYILPYLIMILLDKNLNIRELVLKCIGSFSNFTQNKNYIEKNSIFYFNFKVIKI
jgi:hypothetical protein